MLNTSGLVGLRVEIPELRAETVLLRLLGLFDHVLQAAARLLFVVFFVVVRLEVLKLIFEV